MNEGGLGLAGRGDKKCPLDIVQESSEENNGIPLKLSEWMNHIGYVPKNENLRIEMDTGDKVCCDQTYWSVDNHLDEKTQQTFVLAGPKTKWSTNSFDLQKSGEGYKFVWCPTHDLGACKLYSPECNDLGIFVDEKGVRRLAFSDEPLV
ncbi:LOW QUALITY PROTEIN: hypothetical protein N665_0476s0019 [Sinapis alba]|nr:LOW QUALITY PROTEIN: hypothetical protein N665_0476s0019 [Sinapis alba]